MTSSTNLDLIATDELQKTVPPSADYQHRASEDSTSSSEASKKEQILVKAQLIVAVLLGLAAWTSAWPWLSWHLSDNEMQPVRVVASALAAIGIVNAYRMRIPLTFLWLLTLLVLYNPIMPFHWQTGSWARINGFAAFIFFFNSWVHEPNGDSPTKKHKGSWGLVASVFDLIEDMLQWAGSWRWTWIVYAAFLWFLVGPYDYQGLWGSECKSGTNLYGDGKQQESYAAFISASKKIGWLFGSFDAETLVKDVRETANDAMENDDYVGATQFFDLLLDLAHRYSLHPLTEDYLGAAKAASQQQQFSDAEGYLALALSDNTQYSLPHYITEDSFPSAIRIYQGDGRSKRLKYVPRIKPPKMDAVFSGTPVEPSFLLDTAVDFSSTMKLLVYLEQAEVYGMEAKAWNRYSAIESGKAAAEAIVKDNPIAGPSRFSAAHNLAVYLSEATRHYSTLGMADKAKDTLIEAISMSKRVGDWHEAAFCDEQLVPLYEQEGRLKEALAVQKDIAALKDKTLEEKKS